MRKYVCGSEVVSSGPNYVVTRLAYPRFASLPFAMFVDGAFAGHWPDVATAEAHLDDPNRAHGISGNGRAARKAGRNNMTPEIHARSVATRRQRKESAK